MTKRLLVALDPDDDTPVATRHAVRVAQKHDASLTGLAIVDAGHMEVETQDPAQGSMYRTANLQKDLASRAGREARKLLQAFEDTAEDAGVAYEKHTREGVPSNQIVDEMRFHDLLVIGETPHYFYNQPERQTQTLTRVVRDAQTPMLVVRKDREPPVERVVVAFDGGDSSVRAAHAFAQLRPFGTKMRLDVLHVHDGLPEASERLLGRAAGFFQAHGFDAETTSTEDSRPGKAISAYAEEAEADVVVAGARSVSKLRWLTLGSNAAPLLEECPASLFLHH